MNDARTELLDISLSLFSERGYEGVGVQEIVDAAGVTKPTLYHHFGSKRGLLAKLLAEKLEPFLYRFQRAALHQDDLPLALNRVARLTFEFAAQEPQFYRFLLSLGVAPTGGEPARVFASYASRWNEMLVQLFAAASNPRVHSRAHRLALTFLGELNTWIALALQEGQALDQDLAFQAVHQYMHGIYA
ncbi:MAG: TetR/AcrR family transcriptional regulator [Myxococcales bacterium]|jgi:TetR/AcrR family transcriptional regulator|nr:TetR/AcrR family transcriptional regulator [Myxococcales bacterium]